MLIDIVFCLFGACFILASYISFRLRDKVTDRDQWVRMTMCASFGVMLLMIGIQ